MEQRRNEYNKKRAIVIKEVLDRNGCNYEIERKTGQITFSLEDKYNKLTSSCQTHFFITINRRGILNKDLKEETESNDEIMFDIDVREGVVGIRSMYVLLCGDVLMNWML